MTWDINAMHISMVHFNVSTCLSAPMQTFWIILLIVGCCLLACLLITSFIVCKTFSNCGCKCGKPECPINKRFKVKEVARFICCEFLCPPCPEQMVAKLTFLPPNPPKYTIAPDVDSLRFRLDKLIWPSLDSVRNLTSYASVYFADTRMGNRIACLYMAPYRKARFVIVYSHQNATDMGHMTLLYYELVMNVKCNILAYDYSGYGASTGQPTESSVKADIEAAVKSLETKFGITKDRVILLGQSIGSVPTIHLAARKTVAGVVIVSGLLSATRMFLPKKLDCITCCFNPFANIDKLHLITVPVLFVHGMQDNVINFTHAQEMHSLCPRAVEPLWLPEASHNDVELYPEYYERLQQFIDVDLENFATTISSPSSVEVSSI